VKAIGGAGATAYNRVELADGTRRAMSATEKQTSDTLPPGAKPFRIDNLTSPRVREARTGYYPIKFEGRDYLPNVGEWKTHKEGMERLKLSRRLASTDGGLYYVRYIDDFPAFPINNSWTDTVVAGFATDKVYVVQTNPKIVERCILMTTDPGDLVLDPTCGSGTTAYVAEQWGRRWITIDTSRVAMALARTRLMAARFPYYLLADSVEGRKKQSELTGTPTDAGAPAPRSAQGIRLQDRAARHAQEHRQQSRHCGGNDSRTDRQGDRPARRDRDAVRPALRGQEYRAAYRAVHRGGTVAASRLGKG
jgi:adenine-specific DNA-methyltransferase